MTRDEFETQRHQMVCQHCGHEGLDKVYNPNNNGVRPLCPACGSRTPVAGLQDLPKTRVKAPKRGIVDTLSVWTENGDHCSFCGKSRALCERLGIGLTAQHMVPFAEAGDDWPLIPFCARCQQASAAALAETKRVAQVVGDLDAVIRRIEAAHPELLR